MHVSWYEADAWCRWAGRRLPGEAEWEAAAHQGATRGFRFGDVWEWTASTFRPYPGFVAGPWSEYSAPAFGHAKVLRGASFATPAALRSARFRRFEAPERDAGFFGFRSCAA
jgi:formylglycine-generating enzyme required for sulfatase activity